MSNQPPLLRFEAFSLSLDVIRHLRGLMTAIPDRSLEHQLRDAASSVSLNLAESRGRTGRDRLRFLRIALGSAEEVAGCLHVAAAWGYLEDEQTKPIFAKLDHLLAILGKLTRA
jgi:four helix bundle protein